MSPTLEMSDSNPELLRDSPYQNGSSLQYLWTIKVLSALLEHLTDDAVALLYVTKYSNISLYLTKLYVT